MPIKDTVTVPDGGYTVIRFVANNPGFWLFHCHIEFHVEVGMALVFKVGDYNQMPKVPENFPTCSSFMPHSHEAPAEWKPTTENSSSSINFNTLSNSLIVSTLVLLLILKL